MIKHEKGKVKYVMRTGGTFVRSTMPLSQAKVMIKLSKEVEETDKRGFGMEICVNDKYFFPMKEKEPIAPEVEE